MRRVRAAAGAIRWRCHTCGHETKAYAPIERHMDAEHRGGRIEVLIPLKGEQ